MGTARVLLIALLAAATAAVLASSALAVVVPQRGVDGATIGASEQAVRAALGTPHALRRGKDPFGASTAYRYPAFTVTLRYGHVSQFDVTDTSQRTARAVGLGSPMQAVLIGVVGSRCLEYGYLHCNVGVWKPGRIVTDFAIRVWRLSIGRVLD
jgi:hypothetical protein